MSDWITIGEPDVPQLTPTQARIKELLDAGKKIYEIVWAVHMGKDFVIEEIYQIRKWESIMGKKPKFNKSERAELLRLHNEERYSVGKLATKYGCSQTAVKTALNAAKIEADDEPVQKRTQINPEFDAAVNEMIAESRAADAEEKSANAETEKSSADIPDYVLYAVDCRIADLEHRLQDFADQRAMLEHDLRRLQENIESVQDEHDKLADWKLEVDP